MKEYIEIKTPGCVGRRFNLKWLLFNFCGSLNFQQTDESHSLNRQLNSNILNFKDFRRKSKLLNTKVNISQQLCSVFSSYINKWVHWRVKMHLRSCWFLYSISNETPIKCYQLAQKGNKVHLLFHLLRVLFKLERNSFNVRFVG